jgi:nitrite reductase/ring-hydroxylating ferredoxin subunit
MDVPTKEFALAGSPKDLKAKGRSAVHGGDRPILVIYDRGRVFALDDRCPHHALGRLAPLASNCLRVSVDSKYCFELLVRRSPVS